MGLHSLTVAFLAALVGCTSIRSTSEPTPPPDLRAYSAFAWQTSLSSPGPQGVVVEDEELLLAFRSAVEDQLNALSLEVAPESEADLLVAQRVSVTEVIEPKDPYFTARIADKFEDATLTLDFTDARTGERIWRSTATARLRHVARGATVGTAVRFLETNEAPDWNVSGMVREIFAKQ